MGGHEMRIRRGGGWGGEGRARGAAEPGPAGPAPIGCAAEAASRRLAAARGSASALHRLPGGTAGLRVVSALGPEPGRRGRGVLPGVARGVRGTRGSGFPAQLSFLQPLTLERGILPVALPPEWPVTPGPCGLCLEE